MPYPELWILRHGETVWNAEGRKQGGRDSPLTARGRRQAADQNTILRGLCLAPGTSFQVSPQGRARTTAAIALDGIATPVVDDRLREIGLGDLEGRTDAELWAGWPHVMARKGPLPWHFHAPGGETWEAFNARIAGWLADQRALGGAARAGARPRYRGGFAPAGRAGHRLAHPRRGDDPAGGLISCGAGGNTASTGD